VLELDVVREIYRLPLSHALAPPKRRRLSDFFQAGNSSSSPRISIMDDGGRILSSSFHEQTLNFIYRDLIQIVGGECVQLAYPLPHSTYKCPVIRLDADGRPVAIAAAGSFSGLKCRGESWQLVLVPKKAELAKDGRLLGQIKSHLQQLSQLGFRPVVIPWNLYYAALKQKKNLSFLRQQINIQRA
jgi:hypothetical protein